MKAVDFFIIETEKTHFDSDGSIILIDKFENQAKVRQYAKVVGVPRKYKGKVAIGDTLYFHFNTTAFSIDNGNKKESQYHIGDNRFIVPDNMIHFAVNKKGKTLFFKDQMLLKQVKETEEVTPSGIILTIPKPKIEFKKSSMKGTVTVLNEDMGDVAIGDIILLSKYSDYEITMENGEILWLVDFDSMLAKLDE